MATGKVRSIFLFHVGIAQEFGPPFFVFLACDLPGGISSLQELQGRLHLPIGSPVNGHHEGKEQDPEKDPEKTTKTNAFPKNST